MESSKERCLNIFKICIYFSCSHKGATLYAVFPLRVDLLCFHISADYIFISCYRDAVFFFRHLLAALLSLKEIVVEGFPYLDRLRAFPAKHPLYEHVALRFLYVTMIRLEALRVFFQLMSSLLFFLLSHRYVYRFQFRFGCKALGVKSN